MNQVCSTEFHGDRQLIPVEYFATYGRGCLEFVKNELNLISNHFNSSIQILNDKLEGKILFKTNMMIENLLNLKTIERLFLNKLFINDNNQKINEKIDGLITDELNFGIDFKDELEKYVLIKNDQDIEPEPKRMNRLIKYRVNVKQTGKWRKNEKLKSNLIHSISKKLKQFPFLEVNLSEPDFEIICHLSEISLVIGILLTQKPLSVRKYIKNDGLRSTVCSIMIQIALFDEISQSKVNQDKFLFVLDPFCGKGCLINEWFSTIYKKNEQFFIGSDASSQQVNFSIENINFMRPSPSRVDFIISNLHEKSCFPYKDNSVDLIITDLPFGLQHFKQFFSNNDDNHVVRKFYSILFKEFGRILVREDHATLALLLNSKEVDIFENILEEFNNFEIKLKRFISLGKTCAHLYKLVVCRQN